MTRRCTVSSAVSPVGPDLVGSSVAERERVSPQRARFEGTVRVPRIALSVFALSHPTHPGACPLSGGLVPRSLGGAEHASRLLVCVAERPPMPCDVNH